jgi:hypothetical protein
VATTHTRLMSFAELEQLPEPKAGRLEYRVAEIVDKKTCAWRMAAANSGWWTSSIVRLKFRRRTGAASPRRTQINPE